MILDYLVAVTPEAPAHPVYILAELAPHHDLAGAQVDLLGQRVQPRVAAGNVVDALVLVDDEAAQDLLQLAEPVGLLADRERDAALQLHDEALQQARVDLSLLARGLDPPPLRG